MKVVPHPPPGAHGALRARWYPGRQQLKGSSVRDCPHPKLCDENGAGEGVGLREVMNDGRSSAPGAAPDPGGANIPAPGQTEEFERLRSVLWEMFQLDRGDLDFGLYRIMNLKRAEVERFLNEDLLPQARTLLGVAFGKDLAETESGTPKSKGER